MKKDIQKEKKLLEKISNIYVFIIILIFPIIVDSTGFIKILECKWYAFFEIAICYVMINTLILLYYRLFKNVKFFDIAKVSIIQKILLVFWGICIISTLCSPFFRDYNLIVGAGRGEGLLMTSLYIISFLLVSFFGKFDKKHILYFSIASIIQNLICILQYVGFNPFNMFQNGMGIHNISFMGTIGNKDFISALYCIYIPISFSAYIFLDDSKKNKIIHLIAFFMAFFIFGVIDVQSGKVALLFTLMLIIPFIFQNNKRVSRFIHLIAAFLLSYGVNSIINPEYHYDINQLGLYFRFDYVILAILIVVCILILLSIVIKKVKYDISKNKKVIKYYYIGLIIATILGLIILYLYDFKSGILYEMHELLHLNFDDTFGTYRIFLWKRTLSLSQEHFLLGTGCDSFAIRFMSRYTNDIMAIGELSINDTAANVYLTTLINVGFVGLIAYLSFLVSLIRESIKKINKYSFVLLVASICFMVQNFFNLSLVIITPIFWILLALLYRSICSKS